MKPLLIYDGDCGFCRIWIERWRHATERRVEYAPYQAAASRHPEIPAEAFADSIYFFEPSGATTRAAEAVFRLMSYAKGLRWMSRIYGLPGVAFLSERAYRAVARHRPFFSRVTRLLWGESAVPAETALTARLTLAGLGVCYLAAFLSLSVQIEGLIGADGIMPAAAMLESAKAQLGASRFWVIPTAAWWASSDAALRALCWFGVAASIGLISGYAAGPAALACWALYLSLCSIGSYFLSFQWDALLLEAGLIAIMLAPWSLRPRAQEPPRAALWLMRFLLVKLMFQSGAIKFFSGDPSWRNLTALTYHYWTQPLPNPLSWWANALPLWTHRLSCAIMFCIEFCAPILILLPRRARIAGALAVAFLMTLITLTGNYGFFNLLTLVLCLSCLDDRALGKAVSAPAAPNSARARLSWAFMAIWLAISAGETATLARVQLPERAYALLASFAPLRSINQYGLFAVMTKSRLEIALEVTANGRDWREWPLRYKPGDVKRTPPVTWLHMPRLDWQFWFAALGDPRENPWFGNLVFRILEGQPVVTGLLGPNPLQEPPLYARAVVYDTRFSTRTQKKIDGAWWTRELKGLYFPVVGLKK